METKRKNTSNLMTSLLTFVSITPHLNQGGVNKKKVTKNNKSATKNQKGEPKPRKHQPTNNRHETLWVGNGNSRERWQTRSWFSMVDREPIPTNNTSWADSLHPQDEFCESAQDHAIYPGDALVED